MLFHFEWVNRSTGVTKLHEQAMPMLNLLCGAGELTMGEVTRGAELTLVDVIFQPSVQFV
jgi:hypothetical protein